MAAIATLLFGACASEPAESPDSFSPLNTEPRVHTEVKVIDAEDRAPNEVSAGEGYSPESTALYRARMAALRIQLEDEMRQAKGSGSDMGLKITRSGGQLPLELNPEERRRMQELDPDEVEDYVNRIVQDERRKSLDHGIHPSDWSNERD